MTSVTQAERHMHAKLHGKPLPDLGGAIPDYTIHRTDEGVMVSIGRRDPIALGYVTDEQAHEYASAFRCVLVVIQVRKNKLSCFQTSPDLLSVSLIPSLLIYHSRILAYPAIPSVACTRAVRHAGKSPTACGKPVTVKQLVQHFAGRRPTYMYFAHPPGQRGWVEVTPQLYRRLIRWQAGRDGWKLMYRRM